MKNIFLTLSIFFAASASAQVAIGKTNLSSTAVSLEFYDGADNKRGLVLPWVTSLSDVAGAVNGTFVYNTTDKKVYVKYASGWKDLSVDTTGTVDTSLQNSLSDVNEAKVMIGGDHNTDTTPGILVLGDHHAVMILPKVASPHLNIVNPSPGMMVYDTTTKQLAVFNGTVWSFWKQ
ncbi:hypothetical protein [Cloacibacterium sp. TD35]|uniref:hypothetical protein n=1 Tax=Cloacibacterium sp. TD35 TaxID=2976818 RepID=UPI00237D6CC2|nr:hypothetical protein [Cloacibacterium sp. TD35]WDT67280.1 hypothetical protein N7277_08030 [Cloacibacterium sp. TD35]